MNYDSDRVPFKAGDEFLQYKIHSLLGRGGHAFVYAGQHRYMERPVAIKVIPAPPEMNSDVYKRARLEAKILSQLEHPNVVKVYDAGVTDDGAIYIVMEMLQGRSLRDCLRKLGPFTVPETFHVGIQIAEAVQVAHAQNAIHRDLKPENVFVLPGNIIKVLDFGITKLLGASTMTTQPNIIRGTPQYMSPEHMEGRVVTAQSDIYALGSVLYELLAAIPPALIGLQEITSYAIGYSQIHRVPPRLDEVVKHVPRYVARLIQRMLAKEASDRQASMAEVATELRALQARFVAESQAKRGEVRDLWRAAPQDAGNAEAQEVHSAATAVANAVLTDQVTAVAPRLNSNSPKGTVPLPTFEPPPAPVELRQPSARVLPVSPNGQLAATATASALDPQRVVARAERLISQRRNPNRAPSGPVPVTVPPRPRERFIRYPYVAIAILLGAGVGLLAVLFLRHPNAGATPSPPIGSASPTARLPSQPDLASAAAPSTKAAASATPSSHDGIAELSSSPATHPSAAVLTEPSARRSWNEPAHVRAAENAPSPKVGNVAAPTPKPSASSNGAKGLKNPDKLIFGADDLNW